MKAVVVLLLLTLTVCQGYLTMPDYRRHPCRRECRDDTPPMTCRYNFTVEWYHTLSKACYNCPFNLTDCSRPHCISADGFFRSVLVVNRMLPGPAIQVCHKDTVEVKLFNRMDTFESTGIHWHGIHQKGTQYMDGVVMLTQCPVNPHAIFTYNFEATPSGTHYWHAHAGLQRGDGVYGALVVREPPKTEPHHSAQLYDVDDPDHVMIVNDWTHELTVQKFSSHHHAGDDNKAKGMLINGLGAKVNVTDPDDPNKKALTPRAKFTVEKGKRYRFRVISNAVLNCPIQVSVAQHDLLLIASDGRAIKPYPTPNFIIYGGERYDFVLNANQSVGNYWFRVAGLADCGPAHYSANQAAVIHYSAAPDQNPTQPTTYNDMLGTGKIVNPFNSPASDKHIMVSQMRAQRDLSKDPALRRKPDYKFFFGMDFMKIDNYLFNHPDLYPLGAIRRGMHLYSPQMNNISNVFPASPLLSQPRDVDQNSICSHAMLKSKTRNCPGRFCSCLHRYHVRLGAVVEVIVVDEGVTFDASHPMHLHGYAFRLIGMAKVGKSVNIETVKEMDKNGSIVRNFDNPPSKDTVIVPDGGYVVLRFHADNPGEWFFHCHLLFHSELGMGVVFSVGGRADLPPVPNNFPMCGNYGPGYSFRATTSGAAMTSSLALVPLTLVLLLVLSVINQDH